MFMIRFLTTRYAPSDLVTLRWGPHWEIDRGGVYLDEAWTFYVDETDFPDGIDYKFVLAPGQWMKGDNIHLSPEEMVGAVDRDQSQIIFEDRSEVVTENGVIPQRLLNRNMDPDHEYEVLIVGSGMGGGLLASQLADEGIDVLVLEAGSYLFPTHVGNLPRKAAFGAPQKHVWSLWPNFKVVNYTKLENNEELDAAQAFNLGGRSVFWGGLIPRMSEWELASWPEVVRKDLISRYYEQAEEGMNQTPPDPTPYQDKAKVTLEAAFPGYMAEDAAMALQYRGATPWSVPAGFFSTASLLLENVFIDNPGPGRARPTLNLHFAVWSVITDPSNPRRITGVRGWDLLAGKERQFRARKIVLAAGTIESAKIALNSQLRDPGNKIGKGITDHTIYYRHFTLPPESALFQPGESAKVVLRHPSATQDTHGFHLVVELGAEFNQGLYANPENLAEVQELQNDRKLCELVAMFYADLDDTNRITTTGAAVDKVGLVMRRVEPSAADRQEVEQLIDAFFKEQGAQLISEIDEPRPPTKVVAQAKLGGVGHEVGTLRMADDRTGVVNPDLRFLDYDNLYACDNSVFPASPAANPSLTLGALALRLCDHLVESLD